MTPDAKTRKTICMLSTGGTISMQRVRETGALVPAHLPEVLAKIPELNNPDMPHYTIHEYEKPIDSANMTVADWNKIGDFIEKNYAAYDGFVILHGTDTMAYTASALSFMLENLGKPVILTGSQLPLFETRSDARVNLINALLIAGNQMIPEVCVYFNNQLFRGNRVKKVDAVNFSAFASPNFPALARIGLEVKIRRELVRDMPIEKLKFKKINSVVLHALRIFPGMSFKIFEDAALQALVLETYGVGTAPEDKNFIDQIKKLTGQGVIVVNCSQCAHAKIKMQEYAAGTALLTAGVISGSDMTIEAAITKLFYLFSQNLSIDEIKAQMMINLRGEL